jgi:hypothetical protein
MSKFVVEVDYTYLVEIEAETEPEAIEKLS